MTCEECGEDRPATYRSEALGLESVCAGCIAANHPGTPQPQQQQATVPPGARGIRFTWSRTSDDGDGVSSVRWS